MYNLTENSTPPNDVSGVGTGKHIQPMQLPRSKPLAPPTSLRLDFWGTRGSIPVSGARHLRYGGNTSCVSLTSDTGHLFIFDCGSGARDLGNFLLSENWPENNQNKTEKNNPAKKINGYLFLSHTHWDHIQGFPYFIPVFKPDNRFHIIGWSDSPENLANILAGQMEDQYFPVSLHDLPSKLAFYSVNENHRDFKLDGAKFNCRILKHPLPSLAYRIELGGKVIVYATDHEPHSIPRNLDHTLLGPDVIDDRLVELARGADVLIHDAQYTSSELLEKIGWGHSSGDVAVDTAIKAGVRQLVLYHHDPSHDDESIDNLVASSLARARALGDKNLDIVAAGDGLKIKLG